MSPRVSLVVASYEMARELTRTVARLLPPYQRGLAPGDVELVVVDNGSKEPPGGLPEAVRLLRMEAPTVSPVRAINRGLAEARGDLIGVLIDGARIASPGLVRGALAAASLHPRPIVGSLGFHLGPEVQMQSVPKGYDAATEDRLLAAVNWTEDGYRLFEISVFAGSSSLGWWLPMMESNALFLPRTLWDELGGYDERFVSPGGGLANLDTYARACALPYSELFTLLGEGTFHQVHGGVATNQQREDASWEVFTAEYRRIRGADFVRPARSATFLGRLPRAARESLRHSAHALLERLER